LWGYFETTSEEHRDPSFEIVPRFCCTALGMFTTIFFFLFFDEDDIPSCFFFLRFFLSAGRRMNISTCRRRRFWSYRPL